MKLPALTSHPVWLEEEYLAAVRDDDRDAVDSAYRLLLAADPARAARLVEQLPGARPTGAPNRRAA